MSLTDRNWPVESKSGRLLLRMPSSLHDGLAAAAAAEGVSLNLFICTVLARAVEWEQPELEPQKAARLRRDIGDELWMERHGADRRYASPRTTS